MTNDPKVQRALLVLAGVATLAGVVGVIAAATDSRAVIVGSEQLDVNLYSVSTTGALALGGVGVLALVGVLSRTPVPVWVASGLSTVLALYGLAAWRDDNRNPLGFDGRTISLLTGLALGFAALAWASTRPLPPPAAAPPLSPPPPAPGASRVPSTPLPPPRL